MKKTLVLAEKPAMGKDIAQALSDLYDHPIVKNGLAQEIGPYVVIGAKGQIINNDQTKSIQNRLKEIKAWFEGKLEALKQGTLNYETNRRMLDRLVVNAIGPAIDGFASKNMPTPDDMPKEPVTKTPAAYRSGFAKKAKA